jgi:hypothetical protein
MFGWGVITEIYLRAVAKRQRETARPVAEFPCQRCGEVENCEVRSSDVDITLAPVSALVARPTRKE